MCINAQHGGAVNMYMYSRQHSLIYCGDLSWEYTGERGQCLITSAEIVGLECLTLRITTSLCIQRNSF